MTAIAVALVAFVAVYVIKDYSFLGDEEAGLQDRVYLTRADTAASTQVPPFVVVDFSQADQRLMGYPPVVPRDRIAKLLALIAQGQPALVILDIDIGWTAAPADEAALKQVIAAWGRTSAAPLLIVRQPFGRTDDTSPDVMTETGYDGAVAAAPNVFWVSALAPLDGDGVARRYEVSPSVCHADRTERLVGVQMAACAGLDDRGRLAALRAALKENAACGPDGAPARVAPHQFMCKGHEWDLVPSSSAEIAYTMRWRLPEGRSRPQTMLRGAE